MTPDPTPAVPRPSEEDLKRDAALAWAEWADRREKATVWRRDRSGTPDNRAIDELCFCEGFRIGSATLGTEQTMHRAWRKRAEEAEAELARLRAPVAPEKCPTCNDTGWYLVTWPRPGSPDGNQKHWCDCPAAPPAPVAPAEALSEERLAEIAAALADTPEDERDPADRCIADLLRKVARLNEEARAKDADRCPDCCCELTDFGEPRGKDCRVCAAEAALRAKDAELAGLRDAASRERCEADEALMLAEGPSTLKGLAYGFVERGFMLADAQQREQALREACQGWVDYFDLLERLSERDDPMRRARRICHGARIDATRAALALAGEAAAE